MPSRRQLQALQASRRYGIGRLLLLGRRDFLERLGVLMGNAEAVVQARGRVLPYIDVDGTRSVDLARRMGLSKQAVGKLVRELEEDGLLYREADGADRRAFLVKFTEEGLKYLAHLHNCILQIEREYERLVGAGRMQTMREALSLIAYGKEGALDEGEARRSGPLTPSTTRSRRAAA
jgi:DNA-binding MarR family transcriptional regulator